jgi:hypothetical protein
VSLHLSYMKTTLQTTLRLCVTFGVIGCSSSPAPSATSAPKSAPASAITAEGLRRRLEIIADDSMMGRETGSEGDFKTAAYVAAEFKKIGLEPAGENGGYFQTVPFWTVGVDPKSSLDAGGTPLALGRDFVPSNSAAPARTISGVRAVYGGSAADSSTWISAAQAAGKIVVLDLPVGRGTRGLSIASARWRDATTIAVALLDAVGPETIARFRDGRPVTDTTRNLNAVPTLWISHRAERTMLQADPATLAPGALGAALSGHYDFIRTTVKYPARNVAGILRGSDPALRGEYVALTAHNDHVGFDHAPVDHDSLRAFDAVIRPMGADSPVREPSAAEWAAIHKTLDSLRRIRRPRLDSIRNGADDDGSGTVSILEIAAVMARGVHPKRSILFVSHTGEETGLSGSHWYGSHATVPIDSIVADIDQDMVGRGTPTDFPRGGGTPATPTYLEVVGAKRLSREFGDTLEAANARQPLPFVFDYTFDAPGHPLQYYCRADHYNYARYGIPAVSFSRGEHMDYHQVTDEAQYISYPDLARVSRMVYAAAIALGNMPHRPQLDAPKQTNPNAPCRQ